MSVKYIRGVAIGTESGAVFYSRNSAGEVQVERPRAFAETSDPCPDFSMLPWAPWGKNNLHPLTLKGLIDDCGELQSIIKAKATFAINRGILPVQGHYEKNGEFTIDSVIDDDDINDFIEESDLYETCYSLLKDRYAFGNSVGRLMLSLSRNKIVRIKRDDVTEMRFAKLGPKNIIETLYLSSEWNKIYAAKDNRVLSFKLLNYRRAFEHLAEIAQQTKDNEIAFASREPDWNAKYYSDPDWFAAREWVNINIGVPKMKASMYENNMRPKYIVLIHEDFWDRFIYVRDDADNANPFTEKEKKALRDEFYNQVDKYLAGSENAYKSIFTEFKIDAASNQEIQYIKIQPVDDKSIDGELLKDSSTSGSMIAFSMNWNPAINGGNLPSGPYTNSQGGSNVRESTLLQVMMAEPERQSILRILNTIAKFNGWKKSYPGFRWIISSTIPTTLDTGGSSKPGLEGVPAAKP